MIDISNFILNVLDPESAYDSAADSYDTWSWQTFWRDHEYPIIRAYIEDASKARRDGVSLLDIGCGTGWYLSSLEDLCSDRSGIDISRGMLTIASRRLKNVYLTHKDVMQASYPRERFDVILCTRVLSHIPDSFRFFEKIREWVTRDGSIIITDIDPTHNYIATKLPASLNRIYAKTYKRSREDVRDSASQAKLQLHKEYTIDMSGSSQEIVRDRTFNKLSDLAGWVSVWKI